MYFYDLEDKMRKTPCVRKPAHMHTRAYSLMHTRPGRTNVIQYHLSIKWDGQGSRAIVEQSIPIFHWQSV